MALIKCPECGGTVSDKAFICTHCGYPLDRNEQLNGRTGDLYWEYDSTLDCLYISGNGEMNNFDCNFSLKDGYAICSSPWYNTSIKKIKLSEGISSIGAYAFYQCPNLVDIEFPSSCQIIGRSAFSSCKSLTRVSFPEAIEIIDTAAFTSCNNLNKIEFKGPIKRIGEKAFYYCGFTEIYFIRGLNIIDKEAFSYCMNLRKITIPGDVTDVAYNSFSNCNSLEKIVIEGPANSLKWLPLTCMMIPSLRTIIIPKDSDLNISLIPKQIQIIRE